MTWTRSLGVTLISALALCGCDTGDSPERAAPAVEADTGSTAVRRDSSAGAPLSPLNRSAVEGTAGVVREGGEAVVRVAVRGLEPGTRYATHVHEGRCATGGPIRLPLGRITADEEGAGALRMRVSADRLPETALFVQLHAPDGEPVACADVDGAGSAP